MENKKAMQSDDIYIVVHVSLDYTLLLIPTTLNIYFSLASYKRRTENALQPVI